MKKWNLYTPEGVQDILFDECRRKRILEGRIRDSFRLSGYKELETPTIEFFDVFGNDGGFINQESMYKFCDSKGRILVLRPDLTIPVARIAATKLKDEDFPIKCFYIGNTFSFDQLGGGRQNEFTQAGCEVLGVNSIEADAEVVAMAAEIIRTTGIEEFQIEVGQVEFFKGIMEESGLSENEVEEVRELIDLKDFVGVEQVMDHHKVRGELKDLILDLPRLFGSKEIINRIDPNRVGERAAKALLNIKAIIEILEERDLDKYVSIDLGMVQSMNYYTGIVFRGYTYGVGFPILSGGRYDKLVSRFGRECAATGFSLGINMVMMALDRQKKLEDFSESGYLITYEPEARKLAYLICRDFIKKGIPAQMDIQQKSLKETVQYAVRNGIRRIVYVKKDGSKKEIEL